MSPEERYEYVDAQKYCSALQLGNGAGWRLPTIDELSSLSSKTLRPQVQASFPDLAGTYWSATEESRLRMWVVNLRFSTKLIQGVREKISVRCVH